LNSVQFSSVHLVRFVRAFGQRIYGSEVCSVQLSQSCLFALAAEFIKKVMAGPSEKWGGCFYPSQPAQTITRTIFVR